MNHSSPNTVQIGDSVLYQTLKDEVVLLNMSDQRYYGLNDTGSRMWELLLELRNVSAVEDRLFAEFDTDRGSIRDDLEQLVSKMLEKDLLKAPGGIKRPY